MTPELLSECGRALYGNQWLTPLAEALGVNFRTVHRWAGGERTIPDGIASDLLELMGERSHQIDQLRDRLRSISA